jgi:tetratricopeptide (TPR) repeat protein
MLFNPLKNRPFTSWHGSCVVLGRNRKPKEPAMKSATYILACTVVLAIAMQNMACTQPDSGDPPLVLPVQSTSQSPDQLDAAVGELEPGIVEIVPDMPEATLFAQEVIFAQDEELIDYFEEGRAFSEVGDDKAAVLAFRKALGDRPEDPAVWRRLGKSLLKVGALSRGIAGVEESLRLDDKQMDLHQVLAEAYLDNRMPALAKDHVEVISKAWPEDAIGPYLLGKIYAELKMWNEAIDAYEQSLERDPFNVHAYNNLGFAALQVGKNALASAQLETATGLSEARPYMFNNLGLAYERQGLFAEALAAYARARQLDPTYINAAVNHARLKAQASPEILASAELILEKRLTAHVEVDEAGIEILEIDDVTGMVGRMESGDADFVDPEPEGIPLSLLR